jgi:hypothetical protein
MTAFDCASHPREQCEALAVAASDVPHLLACDFQAAASGSIRTTSLADWASAVERIVLKNSNIQGGWIFRQIELER